ncbi:hypothetical protein GCM10027295_38490 [Pseudaeromonas pectinilytica]
MNPKAVAWFFEKDRDIREETPSPCQLCRMDAQVPLLAIEGQTRHPYAADQVLSSEPIRTTDQQLGAVT